MLNRRTLSARMAMGLIFMTSARTDAADAGGDRGFGGLSAQEHKKVGPPGFEPRTKEL